MIDEPTTEERLAALLARRPSGAKGPVPARDRRVPAPTSGRTPRPAASVARPAARSTDRWPGGGADAPRPPAPAGPFAPTGPFAPSGSVFDFDTPGWPAPPLAEGALPGPARTAQARRLLADATAPLAAVPRAELDDDAGLTDRIRDGAERWVRSWSPARLVASGASMVSFAAMVVAMGPLLANDEDAAATDAGSDQAVDPGALASVEAPAVSISVDPLASVPATPLDATGQPVPLSATTPGGALDPSSSTVAPGAPAPSTAAPGATASTTKPTAGAPAPSAGQGTTPGAPATTAPPATAAPTTAAPGTAAPTTAPPATAAPTTARPTTAAPTTAAPTTAAPTTAPPTTARPTTAPPPTTKGS